MPEARFALVIRPDASFAVIEWPGHLPAGLDTIYREIDSPNIAVIDLSSQVSMWLDDDGINYGASVNKAATAIYAATAPVHQNYYGTAVFTGTDRRGDMTGLTRDRCEALLELAGIEIPKIPHPRIK
ncbi:DUF3846 domain-containing protein [Streptomyces sp. NPDC017230]|uniref:DUF3846 domain-containing protein n=1 Tax=unclassified Streptomyces TaxID=2593676 RepID=UPI00378CCCBE